MNDWTKEHLEKHYVGKMKAVTIPVNIKMDGGQRILNLDEMKEILKKAAAIAQGECTCRKKMGNCIDPMDGCLSLDYAAETGIKSGSAKTITLEEALEALERTQKAGLVHMAYINEGETEPFQICSCCSCCCHSLSAAVRFGYDGHVFSSDFKADQVEGKCTNCGICVDRCQFNARKMEEDALAYDKDKCFGCGLCVTTCPAEAIEMQKRE